MRHIMRDLIDWGVACDVLALIAAALAITYVLG
jgi:hypothetical protein